MPDLCLSVHMASPLDLLPHPGCRLVADLLEDFSDVGFIFQPGEDPTLLFEFPFDAPKRQDSQRKGAGRDGGLEFLGEPLIARELNERGETFVFGNQNHVEGVVFDLPPQSLRDLNQLFYVRHGATMTLNGRFVKPCPGRFLSSFCEDRVLSFWERNNRTAAV